MSLLEGLAELEHKQWMYWSKDLVKQKLVPNETIKRWNKMWIPYKDLPEDIKEEDRKFAYKALKLVLNDQRWDGGK